MSPCLSRRQREKSTYVNTNKVFIRASLVQIKSSFTRFFFTWTYYYYYILHNLLHLLQIIYCTILCNHTIFKTRKQNCEIFRGITFIFIFVSRYARVKEHARAMESNDYIFESDVNRDWIEWEDWLYRRGIMANQRRVVLLELLYVHSRFEAQFFKRESYVTQCISTETNFNFDLKEFFHNLKTWSVPGTT